MVPSLPANNFRESLETTISGEARMKSKSGDSSPETKWKDSNFKLHVIGLGSAGKIKHFSCYMPNEAWGHPAIKVCRHHLLF